MTSPAEVVCCEDLVATLKDPDAAQAGILRQIYVTSRALGSPGSTGAMRQGDLASAHGAKIIRFDPQVGCFMVARNGNPCPEEEPVPDGDIGSLLRSFVRAARGPTFLSITDTDLRSGGETVRNVIPSSHVEMQCSHGPHHSARGTGFRQSDSEPKISALGLLCVLGALLAVAAVYYRFFKSRAPPSELPDTRQHIMARHRVGRDVRDTLDRIRG